MKWSASPCLEKLILMRFFSIRTVFFQLLKRRKKMVCDLKITKNFLILQLHILIFFLNSISFLWQSQIINTTFGIVYIGWQSKVKTICLALACKTWSNRKSMWLHMFYLINIFRVILKILLLCFSKFRLKFHYKQIKYIKMMTFHLHLRTHFHQCLNIKILFTIWNFRSSYASSQSF